MAIASGRTAWINTLGIGAVIGGVASVMLAFRTVLFSSGPIALDLDLASMREGAIAGALVAHAGWVLADAKVRLRRAAVLAVAANILVWVLFLIVTPSLTAAEFDAIQAERDRINADSGLDLVHDAPVIVAGRMLSTFGAVSVAERLLQMFALPAIQWVAFLTVPWKYNSALATRGESNVIAAGGLLLSSAFWIACAQVVSSLVRLWRNRRRRIPSERPL